MPSSIPVVGLVDDSVPDPEATTTVIFVDVPPALYERLIILCQKKVVLCCGN
jgi:hypothetical protein